MNATSETTEIRASVTRMGLALYPNDRRIAEELAEKHHGGNVSRLIRTLLQDAEKRERSKNEEAA